MKEKTESGLPKALDEMIDGFEATRDRGTCKYGSSCKRDDCYFNHPDAPKTFEAKRTAHSKAGKAAQQGGKFIKTTGKGPGAPGRKALLTQQKKKVAGGKSFEGRTWKSEGEMAMRQQFD